MIMWHWCKKVDVVVTIRWHLASDIMDDVALKLNLHIDIELCLCHIKWYNLCHNFPTWWVVNGRGVMVGPCMGTPLYYSQHVMWVSCGTSYATLCGTSIAYGHMIRSSKDISKDVKGWFGPFYFLFQKLKSGLALQSFPLLNFGERSQNGPRRKHPDWNPKKSHGV